MTLQLGLRNKVLQGFKGDVIIAIEDISSFVDEQRQTLQNDGLASLITPVETIYPVSPGARTNLGM